MHSLQDVRYVAYACNKQEVLVEKSQAYASQRLVDRRSHVGCLSCIIRSSRLLNSSPD